jgi:hypothetical protein
MGTKLRREHGLLIGAERAPVTINALDVRVLREKPGPIRAEVYRILLAKHPVGRIGIRVKLRAEICGSE